MSSSVDKRRSSAAAKASSRNGQARSNGISRLASSAGIKLKKPLTEEDHAALGVLEEEVKALRRAERAVEVQAEEEERANPKVSGPRAAKTKAYENKAWLKGVGRKRRLTTAQQEEGPIEIKSVAAVEAKYAGSTLTDPGRLVTDTEAVNSDGEGKSDSAASAHRRGDPDHDSGSAYGNSDPGNGSDSEELSDADREVEEDFGIKSAMVHSAAVTTRKGKSIAAQLQQGTAVILPSGLRKPAPRLDAPDISGERVYGYPTDLEDEISDTPPSNEGPDGDNSESESDREWKEMIVRQARRQIERKKAKGTGSEEPVPTRMAPGAALALLGPMPSGHMVKSMAAMPEESPQQPPRPKPAKRLGRVGTVWPKKKPLARQWPSSDEEPLAGGGINSESSEGFVIANSHKAKRVQKAKDPSIVCDPFEMSGLLLKVMSEEQASTNKAGSKNIGTINQIAPVIPLPHSNVDIEEPDSAAVIKDNTHADVKPKNRPRWVPETELTYSSGNKVAGINSQQSQIARLVSTTIERLLPRALMTISAYPTKAERPEMFLGILVEQATELRLNKIVARLLADTIYAQHMMQIPVDRMCHVRKPLFKNSRDKVWEAYGLRTLEHNPVILRTAATNLLTDNVFIFPGRLANGRYVEVKQDLPFCAGPMIEVLSHLFLGPKACSPLAETVYKSSYTTGEEATQPEVLMVMTAFVATVVGAALREGIDGAREEGEFNASKQEKHYCAHMASLKQLNPHGRHLILGYLYKEGRAFRGQADSEETVSSSLVDPQTAGMGIVL